MKYTVAKNQGVRTAALEELRRRGPVLRLDRLVEARGADTRNSLRWH